MSATRWLIEHVARRIGAAAESVSFGEAVRLCELINDQGEGFTLGGRTGLRLSDEDFLVAVSLVIVWNRAECSPPARHLGTAALAAEIGVPRSTLATWKRRYAHTRTPVPTADVEIIEPMRNGKTRAKPGYSPGRVLQVEQWIRCCLPQLRRTGGWTKGRPRRGN